VADGWPVLPPLGSEQKQGTGSMVFGTFLILPGATGINPKKEPKSTEGVRIDV